MLISNPDGPREPAQQRSRAWPPGRAVSWKLFLTVLLLVLQVGVPASRILQPKPQRFGWHMYAALPREYRFLVERDGTSEFVLADTFLVAQRGDLGPEFATSLSRFLCTRHPSASAIRYRPVFGGDTGRVACP